MTFVGVGITIFLAKTALQVKREFQQRILLPPMVAKFKKLISQAPALIPTAEHNPADISECISRMHGCLESILLIVDTGEKTSINKGLLAITMFRNSRTDNDLRDAYEEGYRLIEVPDQIIARHKWEQ